VEHTVDGFTSCARALVKHSLKYIPGSGHLATSDPSQ
jgi:hypothetical protein